MTGIELMRKKMLEKGMNKAQTTAKAVTVILEILAESQGQEFFEVWSKEKEVNDLECKIADLQKQIENIKDATAFYQRGYEAAKAHCKSQREYNDSQIIEFETQKNRIIAETEDYLQQFNKKLLECETVQGRDTLKTAQFFINNINVETKYDNTAYIAGLAAILSHGGINSLEELTKINPQLPKICPKIILDNDEYIYDKNNQQFVKTGYKIL